MSDEENQSGSGYKTLLGLIVFTVVPLAISILLLNLLYFIPNARIAEAASWVEVPCEVEYVDVREHSLVVYYKYEFKGQSYEGDRYDLMIGESGEDGWARDAYILYKQHPKTVCYVNPDDPAEAVLNRERRHPKLALLLPAVFGIVGLIFLTVLVASVVQALRGDVENAPVNADVPAGERQPSLIGGILGCTFAMGFVSIFFFLMEGTQFVQAMAYGEVDWVLAESATVDWDRDSGTSTFLGDVREYQVTYSVDGTEYRSRCYSMVEPETNEVEYDAERPDRGRIVGTRLYATPRIFLAFPLLLMGFIFLCMIGIFCHWIRGGYRKTMVAEGA